MKDKIRTCPFCGGNAQTHIRQAQFLGQRSWDGAKKMTYYVYVSCNKCKSRGRPFKTDPLIEPCTSDFTKWEEKAIEAWNGRT